MSSTKTQLTQQQNAQIYCVKNGHANYISNCFGYVHCGRCNEQIGDRLGGVYDTTDKIAIGHKCNTCNKLKKKLSPLDIKILNRLEKSKDLFPDYEIILKGVKF